MIVYEAGNQSLSKARGGEFVEQSIISKTPN